MSSARLENVWFIKTTPLLDKKINLWAQGLHVPACTLFEIINGKLVSMFTWLSPYHICQLTEGIPGIL